MPRTRQLEYPGEIHHVMARGLDGMLLFHDDTEDASEQQTNELVLHSGIFSEQNSDTIAQDKEFASLTENETKLYRDLQKNYKQCQERKKKLQRSGWDIDRIASYVCGIIGIEKDDLLRRGYGDKFAESKALLCHWSYRELGISMTKLGNYLGLSNSTVSRLAEKGRQIVLKKNLVFNEN